MFFWGKSGLDEFNAEAFQLCTPKIVAHGSINTYDWTEISGDSTILFMTLRTLNKIPIS